MVWDIDPTPLIMLCLVMFYTVYQITDTISGKIYVGKHRTKDLQDSYMGSGTLIRNAIRKHGPGRFIKTILFVFDDEDSMDAKEAEIVNEDFCRRADTYNLEIGGKGGFSSQNGNLLGAKGFQTTLSRREQDPEWWANYRSKCYGFSGKTHNPDTRKKISESMRKVGRAGPKNSQYGTRWITDGFSNRKISRDQDIPEGWKAGRQMTSL